MQPIISVENLSKQYRLGSIGTGAMAHDLNRWWHRLRGREDPYLKIGEENNRRSKAESDYVWALKDINFSVQPGEVLGIIGRNGAGKSTLLKILSRTTAPTTGRVRIRGRVASLLEVGTGFHPDLSGRENIYLNGAILGMTRAEITRKFDEIVAFAGVERYIDTPVKRYSSGMHVRLGFAVAAHLEPDILIVDEVLAVGDAEFQKKCLGKMKDVSEKEGRTVLFVSHDLRAITRLCNRSFILGNGQLIENGVTEIVIDQYQKHLFESKKSKTTVSNGNTTLGKFALNGNTEIEQLTIEFGTQLQLQFEIECKHKNNSAAIAICFDDQLGNRILSCWTSYQGNYFMLDEGLNEFKFTIPSIRLVPGNYNMVLYINWQSETILRIDNIVELAIIYPKISNPHIIPFQSLGNYVEHFECIALSKKVNY